MSNYSLELPNSGYISENFNYMLEYWRIRNKFIFDMRQMLVGENKITAPRSQQYKVRTMHTYYLASIVNDKLSRFTHVPEIQVIPDNESDDARAASTDLEQAINTMLYEMERRGDGDVWGRVLADVILLDMGVERIERSKAAFWPELVARDEKGNPTFPMQEDARDRYKKQHGIPIRKKYVALENFFPVFEGDTLVESYEVEYRSLRSVVNNPLFNAETISRISTSSPAKLSEQVVILHYVNLWYHSYWLLGQTGFTDWPKINLAATMPIKGADPQLLHAYPHELGESLYNCIGGRYGGWKTENNRIEGIGKGLLELNQKADDMASQVLTNIGARYWPNNLWKIDPELRGHTNGTDPKPPRVNEGDPIILFKGEEFSPMFEAQTDETVPWMMTLIKDQLGRLGGSVATLGMNEPGVYTGYHQQLNITQAEHFDEKIEQHVVQGAINSAKKGLLHIQKLGETVWSHYVTVNADNEKTGRYHKIEPEQLEPLPQMDARIRKPRPIDFVASLRAAAEASNEREGKGPILPDDAIREEILGRTSPDIDARKVLMESQKRKLINSGVLDNIIFQRLNLKLVQQETPKVSPEQINQIDPALQQSIQGASINQAPNMGGIDPQLLAAQIMSRGNTGIPTGMPTGAPQPEAIVGQQVAGQETVGGGRIIGQ